MTDFTLVFELFPQKILVASLLITLLIYYLMELLRSKALSESKIIKEFVNTISHEQLSNFIPTSDHISSLKKQLLVHNLKYSSMVIRQAITHGINAKKNQSRIEINFESIDKLTGRQFEKLLSDLFIYKGYKVLLTKASGDQGVDLILYIDKRKVAIQCKRYKQSNKVGNTAIQEVVTGKLFHDCTEAWVITTSTYTPHAIKLANKIGVKLIDREGLRTMFGDYIK